MTPPVHARSSALWLAHSFNTAIFAFRSTCTAAVASFTSLQGSTFGASTADEDEPAPWADATEAALPVSIKSIFLPPLFAPSSFSWASLTAGEMVSTRLHWPIAFSTASSFSLDFVQSMICRLWHEEGGGREGEGEEKRSGRHSVREHGQVVYRRLLLL